MQRQKRREHNILLRQTFMFNFAANSNFQTFFFSFHSFYLTSSWLLYCLGIWNAYYNIIVSLISLGRSKHDIFYFFSEKSPASVLKVPAPTGSWLLFWILYHRLANQKKLISPRWLKKFLVQVYHHDIDNAVNLDPANPVVFSHQTKRALYLTKTPFQLDVSCMII